MFEIPKNVKAYVPLLKRNTYIDGVGLVELTLTHEAFQDEAMLMKGMYRPRTAELTAEEIKEWKETYAYLEDNCKYEDFETIKRKFKIRFISDDIDEDYSYDFASNEELTNELLPGNRIAYKFKHPSIIKGTVTGSLYLGDVLLTTFVINDSNKFTYDEDLAAYSKLDDMIYKTLSYIDMPNSKIVLSWKKLPDNSKIVASYEHW